MKVRKGFVSNSSSSSFVCDLSGEIVETYEGLREAEMAGCVNDHTFFYEGFPDVEEWVQSDENDDGNHEMPAEICPICNGKAKSKLVPRLKKMLARLNLTVEDLK